MSSELRQVLGLLNEILRDQFQIVWRGVIVVIIIIASSIASVSSPYLFSRAVDAISRYGVANTPVIYFVGYAALLGVSIALQQTVLYLSLAISETLNFIVSVQFFQRLLNKPLAFFAEHNQAEIQAAQINGQQALNVLTQLGLIILIPSATQITISFVLLSATISPVILAVVIPYGVAFVILCYFANKRSRPYLDAAIIATQRNARVFGNAVGAVETLRYFASQVWMADQFSRNALEVLSGWRKFVTTRITYSGLFGLAVAFQFAVTFSLLLPMAQKTTIGVGEVVLFNALLLQLNRPFEVVGRSIDDISKSLSRLAPFVSIWLSPQEVERVGGTRTSAGGALKFENVTFHYGRERVLENCSFEITRGHINFITGATGTGKSTIIRLALKSLEPHQGRITINGLSLSEIDRSNLYSIAAVVPQDILLFNDSIAANIVLGREYNFDLLRDAASKAAILHSIVNLPAGFETVVGERGLKLSGGQRQRIAIARALYGMPEMLFLDEASSALDEKTEEEIMDSLRLLARDVTILAITHRTNVIRSIDKVVHLSANSQPQN